MDTSKDVTNEEREMRIQIARALWKFSQWELGEEGEEASATDFKDVRQEMITKAIKLQKIMKNLGCEIVVTEPA